MKFKHPNHHRRQHAPQKRTQHGKLDAFGAMTAGLAHAMRNPLNGAQLHIALLRRGLHEKGCDPEMLDAATVVAEEIGRLARLVSALIEFAHPTPLTKQPLVLQPLVFRVMQLTRDHAAKSGVALLADTPPQDITLVADVAKLEQVLLNVVQNALEALAPSRGGQVVIRVRRRPKHVVIEVEDDGPGVQEPDAPIFAPFFSTKLSNAGLGLAVTHRIVTDHRGTVSVESRPGRTCFRFTIPLGGDEEA